MKHFFSLMHRGPVTGLLVLLWWLAGPTARAQAPAWQMAIGPAGSSSSQVNATAVDASGNVYVAGHFYNTVAFGTTTLTSQGGGEDAFIAKWSPASNAFLWAQRAGGARFDERVTGLAVSGTNVYITGQFNSSAATFGAFTLLNAFSSGGVPDVFVAKLTDAGTFVWAQQAGGAGRDYANAIGISGANIYVAGCFFGATAAFGSTTLANADTAPVPRSDIFLTKLADNGAASSFVWAQRAGSLYGDQATALAVSGAAVYLTGQFFIGGTNFFGSLPLISAQDGNTFVAKLTDAGPSGAWVWALPAGGGAFESGLAVAVSGQSVYIAGSYCCGATIIGATNLFSYAFDNSYDGFVAMLTDTGSAGNFVWARRFGGPGNDEALALAASGPNVYLTGYFDGPSAAFGSVQLTSAGSEDVFVAKISDAGAFTWVAKAGSTSLDRATSLALSANTVYAGGFAFTPAVFGSHTLASPSGNASAFLASLTDPTLTATTAAQRNLGFSLVPNPAHISTTVQLPAVPGAATATLTLSDALGRTLRTETVLLPAAGLRHELRLSGLPAGLYTVQVRAGAALATRRLVVE